MGVALYALFAALLVPQVKRSLILAVLAGIAAAIHYLLSIADIFSRGWTFVFAIVISSLLGAVILGLIGEKRSAS